MSRLDLKTRLGIRDWWDSPNGPVQSQLGSVKELLGLDVDLRPAWASIPAELGMKEDGKRAVELVAQHVGAWLEALVELLKDDSHEGWQNKLVEAAAESTALVVVVEVVDSPRSPSFTYDKDVCQFALHLPKVTDFHRKEFYEAFKDALLTVFDDKAASELEEDWGQIHQAEVSKTATPPAARLGSRLPPALQVPAYLPSLASLPRPEELMAAPPYHIIVHGSGGSELQVQGTHSPSLELMKEYLTKWCRVNPNRSDGPWALLFDIYLGPPAWGMRGNDTLYIRREGHINIAAPIVLSLAEKLGYSLIKTNVSSWVYRRDQPFQV